MMTRLWRPVCLAAVGVLSLTGCGLFGHNKIIRGSVAESITVTSPAFRDGAPMPVRFACPQYGGKAKTPPLRWSVAQSGVGSLALIIDDPDSPSGAYVHWVLFNIDATANELLENTTPPHSEQSMNTTHKGGYAPPCPPKGEVHRYRFTLYALKEKVPLKNGASLSEALSAIAARTIARGRMYATFRGAVM